MKVRTVSKTEVLNLSIQYLIYILEPIHCISRIQKGMGIDQQHLYHDEYFKQYICGTTRQRLVFELLTHFTLLHILLKQLVVHLSIGL